MFTIEEILRATGGRLISGSLKTEIKGVSIDSRTIYPGELFIAIKGERFDGHDFVEEALRRGAMGVVGATFMTPVFSGRMNPTPTSANPPFINVKDTTIALGDIGSFNRKRFRIPVIGVTGSNGKTTTKEMVAHILSNRFNILKNDGTQNNHIGLPQTLLRLNSTHGACVLEMGMNHSGEIARLTRILKPTIGVITNIGASHLEFMGTIENVLMAKCELLEGIDAGGAAIINGGYPMLGKEVRKRFGGRVITFGFDKGCDIMAEDVLSRDGWTIATINGAHKLRLNVPGRHNIENALASWATASLLGLEEKLILNALSEFNLPPMRMELIDVHGIRIINDSYNSNPLSAECAIETLSDFEAKGRRIMVSGDMLELGDASAEAHRRLGILIAQSSIDMLMCVGNLSIKTADGAIAGGMEESRVRVCGGTRDAAKLLSETVKAGDVVLIKGSRRMKMEEIIGCFTTYYTH